MDSKFTKSNGDIFTLSRLGIMATDFIVSSLNFRTETEYLEGRHGDYVTDRSYGSRFITIPFYYMGKSSEFTSFRDRLHGLLTDTNPYYVEELSKSTKGYEFTDVNEPAKTAISDDYNHTGKRYLVYLASPLELRESSGFVEGEIIMETIESPFAESVNVIKRRFNSNEFTFKNDGNVAIEMHTQTETEITFKGASNGLEIKNLTTGDVWKYNGSTTASDTILLKGVRSFKSGQSIFGQTNRKLISFAPGNNKFELSGITGDFDFTISTRFYFL